MPTPPQRDRSEGPARTITRCFFNQHRSKLGRGGIAWILHKYQIQAADPALANARLSPHILRHSRAMHLYDSGVPLPYIRDILGHIDLSTTEIYARLHRGQTQSTRSRLPRHHHHQPGRMESRPRAAQLARQPLTAPRLCAASGRDHRPHQRQTPNAAHNPVLLIGRSGIAVVMQRVPAPAGPGMEHPQLRRLGALLQVMPISA